MRNIYLQILLSHIKKKGMRTLHDIQGKKQLHFLHIGKTGGSAIKHALTQHSISSRYVINLHRHHVRLYDVPKGEKVIFCLRDPVSRFVSSFYSRLRQGHPWYFIAWYKNVDIVFGEFNTPNELALALSSLNKEKKSKAQLGMKHIQHVRDSYWKWFENEDYFKSRLSDIFFIGFQERLTEDFEILRLKLGLPKGTTLPADDLKSHRNPKHVDKSLEDEAISNLHHWYKDDFEFISLCEKFAEK